MLRESGQMERIVGPRWRRTRAKSASASGRWPLRASTSKTRSGGWKACDSAFRARDADRCGQAAALLVIPSRFDFSDNLRDASSADDQALARFIADSFHDVDVVMIDCAPTESVLTRAAYHASRYVLVPVRPEFFATIARSSRARA